MSALTSAKEEEKLDLEIQKLDLEAQSLLKKNKWDLKAQFMPPIIAMLLGVGGLYLTLNQYKGQRRAEQDRTISEQQKDRKNGEVDQRTRLQNQIRTDIDEILRFTRDENQTVSRISYLLEDIKTVMRSTLYIDEEKQTVAKAFPEYERHLTESLAIMVRDDCDFTKNARDVGVANVVITQWQDYSAYLRGEPDKLDWILYSYIRALESLRDANPGYLEGMTLDDGFKPSPKYASQNNEPILYARFIDILVGFRKHIEVFGKTNLNDEAKRRRDKYFHQFLDALHNTRISNYIVCKYFPDEPCRKGL